MKNFALIFFALLLAGAATLLGVVSVFERTAASPQYYASAINQVSLTGFAVPLAEKLTGQNGKVAQVLQLGVTVSSQGSKRRQLRTCSSSSSTCAAVQRSSTSCTT